MKKLIAATLTVALIAMAACKKDEPNGADTTSTTNPAENPSQRASLASTGWHAEDTIVVPTVGINLTYSSDIIFGTDSTGTLDVDASLLAQPQHHDFTYTFDGSTKGVFSSEVNGETRTANFTLLDTMHLKVAVDPAFFNDTTGMLQRFTNGQPVNLTYTRM